MQICYSSRISTTSHGPTSDSSHESQLCTSGPSLALKDRCQFPAPVFGLSTDRREPTLIGMLEISADNSAESGVFHCLQSPTGNCRRATQRITVPGSVITMSS